MVLDFEFEPGTKYQYSGEGIEYLRKALEIKFKKNLNELASELIFDPLNMSSTGYIWSNSTAEERVALGYNQQGKASPLHKNEKPNRADDLLTTVEDYAKFMIGVMNSEGLSKEIFTELKKHQIESSKGKHFGLGFEIYDFKDGNYALTHGGSDKGAHSLVVFFPKTKKGLLIFTNVDNGYIAYEKALKNYLGDYGKEIMAIEMSE